MSKGRIKFFTPMPGVDNIVTFKEGGVAPFDFTAYSLRLKFEGPFEVGHKTIAAVPTFYTPRAIQIAQVIARGRFTMKVDKIPALEEVPVSAIGAGGGLLIQGTPVAGSAQNMGTGRKDSWALPSPIRMSTKGPRLEAWIDIQDYDLAYMGAASGIGVGAPMAPDIYVDAVGALQVAGPLPFGLFLEFWGKRGLHIKAGTTPAAPRRRRGR